MIENGGWYYPLIKGLFLGCTSGPPLSKQEVIKLLFVHQVRGSNMWRPNRSEQTEVRCIAYRKRSRMRWVVFLKTSGCSVIVGPNFPNSFPNRVFHLENACEWMEKLAKIEKLFKSAWNLLGTSRNSHYKNTYIVTTRETVNCQGLFLRYSKYQTRSWLTTGLGDDFSEAQERRFLSKTSFSRASCGIKKRSFRRFTLFCSSWSCFLESWPTILWSLLLK